MRVFVLANNFNYFLIFGSLDKSSILLLMLKSVKIPLKDECCRFAVLYKISTNCSDFNYLICW